MATIGLPKSSSVIPVARHNDRAPAALRPWVVTRERKFAKEAATSSPHQVGNELTTCHRT